MKRLLIVLFILVMAVSVNAAELRWDTSTGIIDGYTIKWGNVEGEYPFTHNVAKDITALKDIETVLKLAPGVKYWFAITAYNTANVSPDSNVVTYNREIYIPPENNYPIEITRPTTVTITINVE